MPPETKSYNFLIVFTLGGPYNARRSKITPIRAGVKRADKVLIYGMRTASKLFLPEGNLGGTKFSSRCCVIMQNANIKLKRCGLG